MLGTAGLGDNDSSKHKDLNWAEVLKCEDVVQCMMSGFENFINPFMVPDKDHLYFTSSSSPRALVSEL